MGNYVSRRRAAIILGAAPKRVPRIAEAAGVRRLVLPETSPRYNVEDLERLAKRSIVGGPVTAEEMAGV